MDKYIVLRVPGGQAEVLGGVLGGALGEGDLGDLEVSVEVRELTPREVRDQKRDPQSLAMAPEMPVALVSPTEASAAADEDVAWGVRAVGALQSPFTGAGVAVAVLDTGIDAVHEAFVGKTIVQKDFTGQGDGDANGHGTHCAGTILGGPVGGVRIGVAPGVTNVFVGKVLNAAGRGSTAQILDGVLWAARQGANVISMSIGLDFPGLVKRLIAGGLAVEPATSIALTAYRDNVRLFDTLARLVNAQGSLFAKTMIVAAAGNESNRPAFVIATAPPAAADGIMSVGAVGQGADPSSLLIAAFSNGGPDVSAPGVAIPSANVGGGLRSLNGTSMATPHVAGIAALWFERAMNVNPGFLISQIEGQVVGSALLAAIAPGQEFVDVGAGVVQAPRQ